MDRWTEIELFVRTAELGSLSRAAEALGLSNAVRCRPRIGRSIFGMKRCSCK